MADPCKKPLKWSKSYPAYAEKHEMFRVFQELLKELIIRKPNDPLAFIRDELPDIARTLHSPRVFMLGPNVVTQGIGRSMAHKCGCKYLTLSDIVESSPLSVRAVLGSLVSEISDDDFEPNLRYLLIAAIKQRLSKADCKKQGYVLYGFPQNAEQAKCAQRYGLLPRHVFILLPSQNPEENQALDRVEVSSDFVALPEMNFETAKGVMDAYDFEICKTIPFEKWIASKKMDVEAEFLSHIIAIKPSGSPTIPKVLILGPPSSGKSLVAEDMCQRFSFVNVDFIELIRGASRLDDDVGKACFKYIHDLKPLNDEFVKILLQRRLLKPDCETKGWVLHGFPDVAKHLKLLDLLQIPPNRIFLLYCPESLCNNRLYQKRGEVMKRKLDVPGSRETGYLPYVDEVNFAEFPYGKTPFRMRYDRFIENLPEMSAYYGKNLIYVDATQKKEIIFEFMEKSIQRPPVVRFPDPSIHIVFPTMHKQSQPE